MSGDRLALAKVGLRALIDEATGYQEQRPEDDLRRYAESLGIPDFMQIVEERIRLARLDSGAAEGDRADGE